MRRGFAAGSIVGDILGRPIPHYYKYKTDVFGRQHKLHIQRIQRNDIRQPHVPGTCVEQEPYGINEVAAISISDKFHNDCDVTG